MSVVGNLKNIRNLMEKYKIDAYIIPSFDSHQSEYVANYYKCREFISGFTGSAGTVVITKDEAGLWTDGRYFIQAEKQLEGSGIKLFKMGQPNVPTYISWIKDVLNEGQTVGFNGEVVPESLYKDMKIQFLCKKFNIITKFDLVKEIWINRPAMPCSDVFLHDIKYAGKSRKEKLEQVREEMRNLSVDYFIISSLDDIAWLFNIRARDVKCNPVVISYAIVSNNNAYLFVDKSKVSKKAEEELLKANIEIHDYDQISNFISKIENKVIMFDPKKTNVMIVKSINNNVEKLEKMNITTLLKSKKNQIEIENTRLCTIKDCVAEVKFIKWLKEAVKFGEKVTEISATEKLRKFRAENELFIETSFDTIAGYKEHAAMMHYSATKESDAVLKPEGFLLVDSGGQYYDGTTDITRTIALGKLTKEERKDFTLVVKANIGLARAKFLEGTCGCNLDILARKPLWEAGIDYKCGTGHGVGFLLNVHEGPQGISRMPNNVKLEVGMNVTNEPGVYKEGKHGIRLENTMFVVEDEVTEYGGQFLKFETITFCPFDLEAILPELLTEEEKQWLNDYHRKTYEKLSPYLNEEEKEFLKKETRSI